MYSCLFNKKWVELQLQQIKLSNIFRLLHRMIKLCFVMYLFPQTSSWYLTLRPCQTFTSSPRCRSCGRWRPSRWWAVFPFTSSSTCEDASARPTTPSWPLKDWDEPVAAFKNRRVSLSSSSWACASTRESNPDSSPLICSEKFRLEMWKDGRLCQGQSVYWEGELVWWSSVTCYTCLMQRLSDDFSLPSLS